MSKTRKTRTKLYHNTVVRTLATTPDTEKYGAEMSHLADAIRNGNDLAVRQAQRCLPSPLCNNLHRRIVTGAELEKVGFEVDVSDSPEMTAWICEDCHHLEFAPRSDEACPECGRRRKGTDEIAFSGHFADVDVLCIMCPHCSCWSVYYSLDHEVVLCDRDSDGRFICPICGHAFNEDVEPTEFGPTDLLRIVKTGELLAEPAGEATQPSLPNGDSDAVSGEQANE